MLNQYQSLKLKLINVGYDKLDHNWNFTNVISPFSRLYFITKGEAFVYHHNKKYHLLPGNLYLIPSYTYSSYKCNLSHEQYYISFFEELSGGLSIYNFVKFNYQTKATALDEICFKRLLELNFNRGLENNNPKYYDKLSILLEFEKKNDQLPANLYIETHAILKILLSKFIDNHQSIEKTTNSNLDAVISYMAKNLGKNLTVASLADYCNMNQDYFSRIFKKKYAIRPSIYLQNMRTERAILLLITTKLSLSDIAMKIGFDNYTYFLRFFKKQVGKTPKEFRNSNLIM